MRIALLVLMVFSACLAWSQEEELRFGDTEKTNPNPTYSSKKREYRLKRKVHLTFLNSDKLLEGNRCFEDYLDEKRIRLSAPSTGAESVGGLRRVLSNTGARIRGTFRHGPFWVARLNKKRRECRNALHDFIG